MNYLEKLAYSIETAFDIPEHEVAIADAVIQTLEKVVAELQLADEHLDLIYDPFRKYTSISPESLVKNRGVLNRYKQAVKDNYNKIKAIAGDVIVKMDTFSSDTNLIEITNAFKNSIGDVEKAVENFLKILDDFESVDFRDMVIKSVEEIKKQASEAEKIVKDRMIDFLSTNIISKDWTDKLNLKSRIKEKVPYIVQLQRSREESLRGMVHQKEPQALNATDAASVMYPDTVRNMPKDPDVY